MFIVTLLIFCPFLLEIVLTGGTNAHSVSSFADFDFDLQGEVLFRVHQEVHVFSTDAIRDPPCTVVDFPVPDGSEVSHHCAWFNTVQPNWSDGAPCNTEYEINSTVGLRFHICFCHQLYLVTGVLCGLFTSLLVSLPLFRWFHRTGIRRRRRGGDVLSHKP